ncbi:MAG: hypothetical protein HY594_05360 [Candidatus Omnitrophica bacterium]|nr:hypothetical protein [Candidatus Omnitrophota bacterium]
MKVTVLSLQKTLFEGEAVHVIVPGEKGVFEIGPFHRPIASRLLPGVMAVDNGPIAIRRGVIQAARNVVTALVEPA